MLVGILSVQLGAVVSKGLFGEIPPVGMVFLRLITSSLILLAAFLLNLAGRLRSDGVAYLTLNLIGAALAAWSSWLIRFMPFVLLEGTWALVAAIGLVAKLRRAAPKARGASGDPGGL